MSFCTISRFTRADWGGIEILPSRAGRQGGVGRLLCRRDEGRRITCLLQWWSALFGVIVFVAGAQAFTKAVNGNSIVLVDFGTFLH